MLRPWAVSGTPRRPKMPSPGVTLPGPFDTPSSPDPPVTVRWLLTSVVCGVRARRSVRAQSRTGRLPRCYPPFIASPFLLEVYLVPSRCGSRAHRRRNIVFVAGSWPVVAPTGQARRRRIDIENASLHKQQERIKLNAKFKVKNSFRYPYCTLHFTICTLHPPRGRGVYLRINSEFV